MWQKVAHHQEPARAMYCLSFQNQLTPGPREGSEEDFLSSSQAHLIIKTFLRQFTVGISMQVKSHLPHAWP